LNVFIISHIQQYIKIFGKIPFHTQPPALKFSEGKGGYRKALSKRRTFDEKRRFLKHGLLDDGNTKKRQKNRTGR